MEEKILEIMNENSSDANNGQMFVVTEDSYSDVADEIADIFRKFIDYFTNEDSPYAILYGNQEERFATKNKDYTIDELFNFWWNNIKDK